MNKDLKIDDLARMVAEGFKGITGDVKEGFKGVNERFQGVNERFHEVNERLDRIERLILADHRDRIERLETQVKDLQSDYRQLLGMKK